jgi:hypothetical protein
MLKTGIKLIFLYFLRSFYMQPCGWNCQRAEGQGSQKIVCFVHKILVFHFFFTFFFANGSAWRHLQCDRYDLNVKFLIFFKNLTRSTVLMFGVKTLSTKIILAHSYLQIWSSNLSHVCSTWLIWKWGAKDPKKREDHLIFINFGVKKFTLKNTQKNKTLMFECYNLLDPMEWGAVIFGSWCSTR